ncbi:MAG: phosphohydrolase [Methylibium sp. NZG]|nr:MAG: phosphohydrolase [Methylibium sp. NZG]
MCATPTHELIDVHDLQIGMVVHLDGGWMAHPFPLSRFKIVSSDQIATIRSLGLKQVRWEPLASDVAAPAPAGTFAGTHVNGHASPAEPMPAAAAAPPPPAPSPPAPTHREQLARQREVLHRCERQFAEAASACTEMTRIAGARPLQAGAQAKELSQALVTKMLGEQDMCIQLLSGTAGSKAAAHALNVTILSLLLGRKLGLDETEMLDLGVGAVLHDIGKTELPERVRQREDHFIAAEVKEYEEHVAHGVACARRMGLAPGATLVVAQHHEHCDGSGFPLRPAADRLSLPARIVALVNRYDKLCNPNLAARALTPHEALAQLFAGSAQHFDKAVMAGFIKMMGVYPPGSTVQLSDERYALVVSVNAGRPLKPCVLVHDARVPREDALVLDLQAQAAPSIRRSVRPLQLPAPALNYLAPARRVVYFFEPAHELDTVS